MKKILLAVSSVGLTAAGVAKAQYLDVSTGLDSAGNIQHKGGSLDANWTVAGAMNPLDPPNAYVVAPGDVDWGGRMDRQWSLFEWIAANPYDATDNGLMTFTTTFDVATPSTATIIGGASIDDLARLRSTAICSPRCQTLNIITSMRSLRPRATSSRD